VKAKKFFPALVLLSALQLPGTGHAGVYSDDLGKCLVSASTAQEKQQLVQWIFFSISLNPAIKPYSNITQEQREASDRDMAKLLGKLLGESCTNETKQAVKYEGSTAFSTSFRLLGEVAGREMFSSPEVSAGAEAFTNYLDVKALQEKLGIPAK
jgi:hypothetical protein